MLVLNIHRLNAKIVEIAQISCHDAKVNALYCLVVDERQNKVVRRSISLYTLFPLLVACNSATDVTQLNTGSVTEMTLPQVLRGVAAIDPSGLQLQVSVNDVTTTLLREGDDIWRGSVEVPANQTSRVEIEWGTDYGNSGYVRLAAQQRFIFVGAEERTIIFDDGYSTSFDDDNDTRTNLSEIEQNRSPVDRKDVFIGANGTFAEGISYPSSGVCGHKIPINVLTRGASTDPDIWWCAKLQPTLVDLDGNEQNIENLQLTVSVEDDIIFTDGSSVSEDQFYHDDSIEIYIDGDNNKRGPYDGLNDFQFRFVPIGDGVFNVARGPNSFSSSNLNGSFEYYNGGYILTATIPLQEVGIRKGFEFGINVEVSDDDDGGDRDAKYAWVAAEGVDDSWTNTRLFGTSQVE